MTDHQRGPARYLGAALELLDAYGSADPTLGITMKAAATGSAVTRSTIYRNWETVGDLNDDVVRYAVSHGRSWQLRWLAEPYEDSIDAVLERVLGPCAEEFSVLSRSAVSSWPATSPARTDVAAWEWRWLRAFGAWIDAHLRTHGHHRDNDATPLVMAATVAGYLEGVLILSALQYGMPIPRWGEQGAPQVAASIKRILEQFVIDGPGRAAPVPPPDLHVAPVPIGAAQVSLLHRAWSRVSDDFMDRDLLPVPGRAVDIGRLARKLDVSERVLYRIWPTAQAMNTDLFIAVLERHRQVTSRVAAETFTVGLRQPFATFKHLVVSAGEALIAAGACQERASQFTFSLATIDAEVRTTAAQLVDAWRTAERTTFLALVAMCGWHRRPELTTDEFTATTFNTVAGVQRLATLNPELLNMTIRPGSPSPSVVGLAVYFSARSVAVSDVPGYLDLTDDASAPTIDTASLLGAS